MSRRQELIRLRDQAFHLTPEEPVELAHDLVASLDGSVDSQAANPCDAEPLRDLDELESRTSALIDRDEVSRRMHEHRKDSGHDHFDGPRPRGSDHRARVVVLNGAEAS